MLRHQLRCARAIPIANRTSYRAMLAGDGAMETVGKLGPVQASLQYQEYWAGREADAQQRCHRYLTPEAARLDNQIAGQL